MYDMTTTHTATMTPAEDAAMQRLADAAVNMLSGMIAARDEIGMADEDILPSIIDSLRRMFAEDAK